MKEFQTLEAAKSFVDEKNQQTRFKVGDQVVSVKSKVYDDVPELANAKFFIVRGIHGGCYLLQKVKTIIRRSPYATVWNPDWDKPGRFRVVPIIGNTLEEYNEGTYYYCG